jgi:hypothetical protein
MRSLYFRFFSAAGAICGTLLLTGVTPTYAQFTENFNSTVNGQVPSTFTNSGGFTVNNGVFQSSQPTTFNFSTISAAGFTSLTDATLTFDLLNARDSGAILRSDATGDNAVALIVRPTVGDLYFIQRSGGSFSGGTLGGVSLSGLVASGDNVRVTFSSTGNTFFASVAALSNPNTVLQSTSFTFGAGAIPAFGRAGVYQFGSGSASQFDNVSINVTSAPEPGTIALVLPALLGSVAVISRRRK